MKIRKIIVALAAVLVPFLVFRVESGLTEQQNVTLRDYTVSENEKTLTLHAAVFPPIEDIRDYKDEQKNGKYIRQERYAGSMSRSFYVGEGVRPEDVKGKFENGILQISLPKAELKKLPAQTMIAIE